MLPTNEKATGVVMLKKSTNKLVTDFHSTRNTSDHFSHELYIFSDEKKEGDWCYDWSVEGKLCKYSKPPRHWSDTSKKIIATTDKSLLDYAGDVDYYKQPIQLIPQSFIEKFVSEYNNGNIITEVMVEYAETVGCKNKKGFQNCLDWDSEDGKCWCDNTKVKINSDNTINIKPIKDSWSRKEVVELLKLLEEDIKATISLYSNQIFNK
ncbi:hypothetical protein [Leptolyngbya phage Lbo-JY46]